MMRAVLLLALWGACQLPALGSESGAPCRRADPLRLRVQFYGEAARNVLLESTEPAGFRLRDAMSAEEIWSIGPSPASTQHVAGMNAHFGVSFAAVHLDADDVHDLLYAGDRTGRVWRFDLRSGARRNAWLHATLIAELGAPAGGRGFIAPPDVALVRAADGHSWLNISLGTANTGEPRHDHRFYVLRDAIAEPREAPLSESDLEPLTPPAGVHRGNASGYYLSLGSSQVLAQALTLHGRIHFVVVESSRNLFAACAPGMLPGEAVQLSVTVLRAEDGSVELEGESGAADSSGRPPGLRRPLATTLPASAGVVLATTPGTDGHVACMVDTEALPGCALDARPRRSWWRREDAD